jgi:hypothetical protein
MELKRFTFVMGIIFLGFGILGFVPNLLSFPDVQDPVTRIDHGVLFGLFPVNAINNTLHIILGVWGLSASLDLFHSRRFCKSVAVLFVVLAVMGLFPVLNTVFGIAPLYGHNIWLHTLFAAITGYFGFMWDLDKTLRQPRSTDRAA